MSYRVDLDEYDEETLRGELKQRAALRRRGKCDYCGRTRGVKPSCKFRERHKAAKRKAS